MWPRFGIRSALVLGVRRNGAADTFKESIMQTTKATTVNGVNVEALSDTLKVLSEKPSLAQFTFRADNTWEGGGFNRSTVVGSHGLERELTHQQPFTLEADEPEVLLGTDRAAGPVEHLLHALASCMTTSIVYHAAARGIEIESLESSLDGDIDLQGFLALSESVPKGYQAIRVVFRVKSTASVEEIEQLYSFSPVYETISRSVPVEVRIEKV
jgi:uncharacterized OsmC-like protein